MSHILPTRDFVTVDEHSKLLAALKYDGRFCWQGRFDVPCWGLELPVCIVASESKPTARQLSVLAAVLAWKESLREQFAIAVYEFYQRDVYGSFDVHDKDGNDITHQYAPHVLTPEGVWDLIQYPNNLTIPQLDEDDDVIKFVIGMECKWDPDHGLSVRFENWKVANIGGETDV